jgi:hypothetical protein
MQEQRNEENSYVLDVYTDRGQCIAEMGKLLSKSNFRCFGPLNGWK